MLIPCTEFRIDAYGYNQAIFTLRRDPCDASEEWPALSCGGGAYLEYPAEVSEYPYWRAVGKTLWSRRWRDLELITEHHERELALPPTLRDLVSGRC